MGEGARVAQKNRSEKGLCFSFLIILPASPHMVFCYVSQTELKLPSCLSLVASETPSTSHGTWPHLSWLSVFMFTSSRVAVLRASYLSRNSDMDSVSFHFTDEGTEAHIPKVTSHAVTRIPIQQAAQLQA